MYRDSVFAFYMDAWLAQLALSTLREAQRELGIVRDWERKVIKAIAQRCQIDDFNKCQTLEAVTSTLRGWQIEIDQAVNNAPLQGELSVNVRANPGKLVFGVPQAFSDVFPALKKTVLLYLIDELENFNASQQRYINTLVERAGTPCSFKIGARPYGIRTYRER